MVDNMRGWLNSGVVQNLQANAAFAESEQGPAVVLNSTGFRLVSNDSDWNGSATTYIYIAIRRGPMKVPTVGTTVFSAQANIASDAVKTTTGFVTDWFWERPTYNGAGGFSCSQRLTQTALFFSNTAAEGGPYGAGYLLFDYNNGFLSNLNGNINPGLMYGFRRAPSFCDVVCWTGNGTGVTVNHNLTVAPELIILKSRSAVANWVVRPPGAGSFYLNLNNTNASTAGSGNFINNPTATTFSTGDDASVNTNGVNYIAYLFASCTGVSKVGTYTGTGATLTIDCGFTGGARFVMIKRTSNTGNWFVWDTARGMVSGTDPRIALNSTAAEANSNWVYTVTGGFQLVEFDNINISGSTYLYLAIA
jgi:hypothetical protein